MCVYVLHFTQPLKHAHHYVGWSKDLNARLAHHKAGTGARLMQVVGAAGIEWTLARVWPGETRTFERTLKNTHRVARYCPVCAGEAAREYTPKGTETAKDGLAPVATDTHVAF